MLGGLQSKPGAPVATAVGKEPPGTQGGFPGAETGSSAELLRSCNAWRAPTAASQRRGGLLLLFLDSLHFLRMDQKPLSAEMTKEHLRVGSPVGFSQCLFTAGEKPCHSGAASK